MSTKRERSLYEAWVDIPNGVDAQFNEDTLIIKGPLGVNKKDFSKINAKLELKDSKIHVVSTGYKVRDRAIVNTVRSIIRNMVIGVTEGFNQRLKIVYAHFPMMVKVKENQVIIENFYGERAPRIAKIVGSTKVRVEGEDIIVTGISAEDVGQTAANIEKATSVKKKDQRVFLDGIYVYEKGKGIL